MDKGDELTEEDKLSVVDKLAEKMKQAEEDKLIKKAKLINETRGDKARRYVLGPFQFLVISLIASESLLVYWMSKLDDFTGSAISTNYNERIVVGSLFIAVLIATLVVFSVIYSIKRQYDIKREMKD